MGVPLSNYVLIEGAIYDYGEAKDNYFDGFGDLITVKMSSSSVNFGIAGILPRIVHSITVGVPIRRIKQRKARNIYRNVELLLVGKPVVVIVLRTVLIEITESIDLPPIRHLITV